MLSGRESLTRIVGKRKRTLSSQLSHLLQSQPKQEEEEDAGNPSSLVKEEEEAPLTSSNGTPSVFVGKQQGNDDGTYDSEWVSCPVCGASIRGTDSVVNSHLDTCLTRGTKRKLTQRTLLQLNFCPVSGSKTSFGVDNNRVPESKSELVSGKEFTDSEKLVKCRSFKNDEKSQFASYAPAKEMSNLIKNSDVQMESIVVETTVNCKIFPQSMRLTKVDASGVEDANFVKSLETFIVGRKFHDNVELQQNAGLSLLRDPQNAKDKHAIKVLSADSRSQHMLGYLPREVAKFLSPLIDNHHLKCEGSVISLPEHPLDAVPIRLVCQKMVACDQLEFDDHQNFELLWENVQHVTDCAKINPPSMAKYQQNFHLMIEDVVNNYTHLFTSNEKLLLGSFDSLGNDAQRLFIRIYSRKGPWFRLSKISYPEILDLQRASEELQLAGYICSFNSSEDIVKYNMKEVLELLTVFEMREVSNSELSKATSRSRRQELIDSLFSAYEDGTCRLLPRMVLERVGMCIKISSAADTLLWRVQRLFFLNGEQDLSAFLLSDLGLIKFPDYTCTVAHPIFKCRSDLLEYEEAVEVAQIMDESLDENNVDMVMRCIKESQKRMQTSSHEVSQTLECDSSPAFFSCFSAAWVYSKVLSLGVAVYERDRRLHPKFKYCGPRLEVSGNQLL